MTFENPGLPDNLWKELDGRLWHATEIVGLRGIVDAKEIRVSVAARYRGSFCRGLGGISLFDFGPTSTDNSNQFHNWWGWFGHQQHARIAIWLELDRVELGSNLLSAATTLHKWHAADTKPTIIPGVEACHIGAIPIANVKRVLFIDAEHLESFVASSDLISFESTMMAFQATLPPPRPESDLVRLLRSARERSVDRS